VSQGAFDHTPIHQDGTFDGVTKRFVFRTAICFCQGCCCRPGRQGLSGLPLEEYKRQWKERGIRRRFHLTISGCLGPCPLANVILIQFHGNRCAPFDE